MSKTFIVTGGSGFFGDFFIAEALSRGNRIISIDIVPSERQHPALRHCLVDIRDKSDLRKVFSSSGSIDGVFHFAALLAHGGISDADQRAVNVDGTHNLLDCCKLAGVHHLVFTSSNCLWGNPAGHPIAEEEPPCPCESYGQAKWDAEKILLAEKDVISAIIRTPTIIQAGRLGLLAILFEFIDEGRKIWTVGNGSNRYQFIAASDLADACMKAINITSTQYFNVGSDNVPSLGETYQHVIKASGSRSRLASFPEWIAIPGMRLAHLLHMSPLGPYHWKMIAESFEFDTRKAKKQLG